jgi:hypothetical protein
MRIDRPTRAASFLLTIAVGMAFTNAGCGSGGDGTQVKVSPEVEKKTQDMLGNMHKNMAEQHKAKNAAAKGP